MKKVLVILLCMAGIFSACNKKDYVQGPPAPTPTVKSHLTFEADPSSPDRSVQAPSSPTLKTLLKVGSVKGGVLKGGWITFDSKGAFRPDRDVKNFFMRIKDPSTSPATIVYTSPVYTSVTSVNTLPQMSKNIEETKTYNVEFSFDVLSTATDNVPPEDSLILGVGLYYSHRDAAFDTVTAIVQRIAFATNPTSTMSATLSANTVATSNVLDNQKVPLITTSFNAVGGVSAINKVIYKFADPLVSPAVSTLEIYDGTTFLTSANVSGGLFTFNQNINVPASKEVTIKAVVGTVDETTSGRSLKLIQDRFEYTDVGGNAKFDDVDIAGKDQYVFAALPEFTKENVSSSVIVNNVQLELYKHSLKFVGGDGSQQQFTYEITLSDVNNDDTLTLRDFKLFENGVDVTAQYKITKASGVVDSVFRESDTKITFTKVSGGGETLFPVGVTKTYSLRAKTTGFNNSGMGNNMSVRLIGDTSPVPFDYKFVNTGGINNTNLKLSNTNSTAGPLLFANYIFSDKCRIPHNSGIGNSTPDHYSGAATGKPVFTGLTENNFYD